MSDDVGLAVLEHVGSIDAVTTLTTRSYTDSLPQNATLPAYVIDCITNNPIEHLTGSSLSVARVRIDSYAATRKGANELSETIRTEAMKSNHKGHLGSTHQLDVREISIAAGPYWLKQQPRDGSDDWRAVNRCDYLVTYRQTGPSAT